MNHLLEDYWEDLRWEALITWQRLNLAELNQVNGNAIELEKLIQREYEFKAWQIQKQIKDLINRYDNLFFLADWNFIKVHLLDFWPPLDSEDIKYINGSRIRLLRTVERKYGWTKEKAMDEVSGFLRQFMD